MLEILTLSGSEARPFFSQMASIYQLAFAGPPYHETLGDVLTFEGRLPYHARWKDYRCVVARSGPGAPIVGFAYGYATQPDTWWHEQVVEHMPAAMIAEWLAKSFEFVELAVLPEFQGRGIGGRIHDALLAGLPHHAAVLSTPQQPTNALFLYQKRGWITLLDHFIFPGVDMEYRIMGKKLVKYENFRYTLIEMFIGNIFVSDPDTLEDPALLKAIARGDSAALGRLYDRYGRLVYSLAVHILSDPAMAEEITQEVFLQVWNKAASYQPEQGKVVSWLASVARHRAIDSLRRRNARPEGHTAEWLDGDAPDIVDPDDVEDVVELSLRSSVIRRAMRQLPSEQKTVLALAFFQGMTHQEISNSTGEPLGTVKTRIRLAMQKLRQMLDSDPL